MRDTARSLWHRLMYERRCAVCHAPFVPPNADIYSPCAYVCAECHSTLPRFTDAVCPCCGVPCADPLAASVPCGTCVLTPPPWKRLLYYGHYTGVLQALLRSYKFQHRYEMLPLFCAMFHILLHTIPPCERIYDAIIPIPRHATRLRTMGRNHIVDMAKYIAHAHGIPLNIHALTRSKATPAQLGLQRAQRLQNPKWSFIAHDLHDQRVLLLDDVITTGATLHHASLALRQAGVENITAVVIARTPYIF